MGQRVNVLWGIVVTLLVACMVWIGFVNYRMSKEVEHLRQQKITLGTDQQLEETVNTLEKNLVDRLAYQTHVEVDPLDLTRVIQSKSFLASLGMRETLEQQGRMRLSCTVIGDNPAAIIKFMGRSHVVYVGDVLNGFRVEEIGKAQVIMAKGGSRLVLVNEAAPEGEYTESGVSRTSVSGDGNY